MKRVLCYGLLMVLAVAGSLLAQGQGNSAPREVLVQFRGYSPALVQDLERGHDLDVAKGIGGSGAMRLRSRSRDTNALIQALSQRPDVVFVEPNYILTKHVDPSDQYWPNLWGMAKISAPAAWEKTIGWHGPVVGVVDTGVDYNHIDLAANIWSGSILVNIGGVPITCPPGSHGFNAITNACNPLDDGNHGTHVSGTIGAIGSNSIGVVGVNWVTSIMGLKFLNSAGSGYTSDAIEAIEFAVQAKLNNGVPLRILSNSWGGGSYSQALYNEIKRAGENEILFVASAGNNGWNSDSKPSYPASYNLPNIISVAATDSADQLASWSNFGVTSVDLGAPGVSILSTLPNNTYDYYSGTSMAAPHVSGAAALVLSAPNCMGLNTAGLKAALLNNVDPVSSLAGKTLTGGRLNVAKAIANCTAPAPPPDFAISASPSSASVRQGRTATYNVAVSRIGTSSTVGLTVFSGCPASATCTLSPNAVSTPGNSTLTVATRSTTPLATYTLVIKGTSGTVSHTTSVGLTVKR